MRVMRNILHNALYVALLFVRHQVLWTTTCGARWKQQKEEFSARNPARALNSGPTRIPRLDLSVFFLSFRLDTGADCRVLASTITAEKRNLVKEL